MIRALYLLFFTLIFFCTSYCQSAQYGILNANELSATLGSDGNLFLVDNEQTFKTIDYIGCPATLAGMSSLWVSAKDSSGEIYASRGQYGVQSMTHGFIDQSTGVTFEHDFVSQDRVWKVKKQDIESIIAQWEEGEVTDVAKNILDWPAKGNPLYGDFLANRSAAPFHDVNGDGIYNPYDGDYPSIGETNFTQTPSQILLAVSNDTWLQDNSALQLEIFTLLYAFNCNSSLDIQRSIFQKQILYNRSSRHYKSVKIGQWTDAYLPRDGAQSFGSDPENDGYFYYFNRDVNLAEVNIHNAIGSNRFTHPPVLYSKVINGTLDRFMYNVRSDVAPPEVPFGFISSISEIYNFLSGLWPDGIPLTTGGYGYNPGSSDTTDYAFSGEPLDTSSWAMVNEDFNLWDTRVLAIQEFPTLAADSSITVELMHLFVQDINYDNLQSIELAKSKVSEVLLYLEGMFSVDCQSPIPCSSSGCVIPGDVNNNEIIERTDIMLQNIAQMKSVGFESPREYASIRFDMFDFEPRSEVFKSGVNYSHADCNGDGLIDDLDLQVYQKHFGEASELYLGHEESCDTYPGMGKVEIRFNPNFPSEENTSLSIGEIILTDFDDVHSLSFKLVFDTLYFESAISSLSSVANLTLASGSKVFIQTDESDTEVIILTAADSTYLSADTTSFTFFIKLKDGFESQELQLKASDILLLDFEENFYCMENAEAQVVLTDVIQYDELSLTVFPNPASNYVNIFCKEQIKRVELIDLRGKAQDVSWQPNQNRLDLRNLKGVYFIQIEGESGNTAIQKLVLE